MNERFKQLSLEAGGSHYPSINPQMQQRFAELIVEECMQVSLKHSHRDDDMGAIIARNIKQHFGVEL